ncbi:hypothetical protein LguiA_021383 [Lonicera macranthoides]
MILNGCSSVPVGASLDVKAKLKSYNTASLCIARTPSKVAAFSSIKSSCVWRQELKYCSPKGISHPQLASSSSPLMIGDIGLLPRAAPRKSGLRRSYKPPKAILKFFGIKNVPMTRKPRFWWRILACVPYLMPLHETWMYAKTAYHLHPFLEDFKYLTYPFLRTIGRLPGWFLMAYFFCAYLGVVRRKAWPHFFRYHVVMGMLLEISLQVTGTISRWMPKALYWGKIGMHLWTALAFGFLFTVLECMRCAIIGYYADVPFMADAAYIQVP